MCKNCVSILLCREIVVPLHSLSGKGSRRLLMNTPADIKALISQEFQDYELAFERALRSDNPLLNDVGEYLLQKRGKQVRPMLTILAAKLCHGSNEKTIDTAVAMEMLHTASLVHDDVVDCSPMRRGVPSVQARWNNKVAVLGGDYMLAKVIELTANLRNLKIFNIVAEMGQTLSSGELLQLHANESMWISEQQYMRVIEQKTAALFAACMQAGAVSSGATMRQESALRAFGLELGLVFQLKDDILDYSDSELLGKPTMGDIRDGKATLPLLISLERAPQKESDEIRRLAESLPDQEDNRESLQTILSFVLRYDGIRYCQQQMELHKRRAIDYLSIFHNSSIKSALIQILEYTISRVY